MTARTLVLASLVALAAAAPALAAHAAPLGLFAVHDGGFEARVCGARIALSATGWSVSSSAYPGCDHGGASIGDFDPDGGAASSIDVATGAFEGTLALPGFRTGVSATDGERLLTVDDEGRLVALRPGEGAVALSGPLGISTAALEYDAATGQALVVGYVGDALTVLGVDASSGAATTLARASVASMLYAASAYDPVGRVLWGVDGGGRSLFRFDLDDGAFARPPSATSELKGLAHDPARGLLAVAWHAGALTVLEVDESTGRPGAWIAQLPDVGAITWGGFAYDAGAHRLALAGTPCLYGCDAKDERRVHLVEIPVGSRHAGAVLAREPSSFELLPGAPAPAVPAWVPGAQASARYAVASQGVACAPDCLLDGLNVGAVAFPPIGRLPGFVEVRDDTGAPVSFVACQDADGDRDCGETGEPNLLWCGFRAGLSASRVPFRDDLAVQVFPLLLTDLCGGRATSGEVAVEYA